MALLTTINGIPLYTTIQEALAWARANGLSGYHTHGYQGQIGYMGGTNHTAVTQRSPTTSIQRQGNFTRTNNGSGSTY